MVKKNHFHFGGFSIIEVLIGIFVFSLGLVSIYALLASSLTINDYNKNAIIAGNLAREQIELIRNVRDTNYQTLSAWNRVESGLLFAPGKYYTIHQDMGSGEIDMGEILNFSQGESELSGKMQEYRLCFDARKHYVYCNAGVDLETTPFYRYVYVEETYDGGVLIDNAFTITSKVIWYKRGYHDFDIKTIITDWRRI